MVFEIIWTSKSYEDIVSIYEYLVQNASIEIADKIIDEIYAVPDTIKFPWQFQFDEYRSDCRRIIVRNYKILYHYENNTISIMRVFSVYQDPEKSLK